MGAWAARMVICLAAALVTFPFIAPAWAGLDARTLAGVGYHPPRDAKLPLGASVAEGGVSQRLSDILQGRPALVSALDYRCRSLCGLVLDQLSATLPKTGLAAGRDYVVITFALDPAATATDAAAFKAQHVRDPALMPAVHLLTETSAVKAQLAASLGLVAPFDEEHQRYAHPAGLVVVDAEGRPRRVLSPFGLDPNDLKLALTEQGAPSAGLAARILTLCYGYDAAHGLYTVRIERILGFVAALTVLMLALGIVFLLRLERRSRGRGL